MKLTEAQIAQADRIVDSIGLQTNTIAQARARVKNMVLPLAMKPYVLCKLMTIWYADTFGETDSEDSAEEELWD